MWSPVFHNDFLRLVQYPHQITILFGCFQVPEVCADRIIDVLSVGLTDAPPKVSNRRAIDRVRAGSERHDGPNDGVISQPNCRATCDTCPSSRHEGHTILRTRRHSPGRDPRTSCWPRSSQDKGVYSISGLLPLTSFLTECQIAW